MTRLLRHTDAPFDSIPIQPRADYQMLPLQVIFVKTDSTSSFELRIVYAGPPLEPLQSPVGGPFAADAIHDYPSPAPAQPHRLPGSPYPTSKHAFVDLCAYVQNILGPANAQVTAVNSEGEELLLVSDQQKVVNQFGWNVRVTLNGN